jgi:hypothetical protein
MEYRHLSPEDLISTDETYRRVMAEMRNERRRQRYATDPDYRAARLHYTRQRYATDPEYRAKQHERKAQWRAKRKAV